MTAATAPVCNAVESWPIGYDETQEGVCLLPRGHAGAHVWSEC